MKLIHLSLLSLLALPLAAQDTGFSVGGGLIAAPKTYFGAYDKVVNNNLGYYVNGAYTVKTAETDLTGRFTASLSSMPGKSRDNGLKTSLSLFQVSADLVFPVGVEGLSGVFGVSLNKFSVSNTGTESVTTSDVANHFPVKDGAGIKGGFRIGAEYAITKNVKAELVLQQTELGGQNGADPVKRAGGVNPSWLNLGVRYSF